MASLSTQVPRRRWIIGGLLGRGVLVNSIDRITLSVAAPQIRAAFHLMATDIGLLFSGFGRIFMALGGIEPIPSPQ
ncbi:hypothetical protein [Gluconacetobacter takamatsuzukensis]|uniref:MFS transporter n=1 Tax=Gluconacetobacter takamatsuzukensis TaxID=1286190 RepID=A0A7W4KGP3_9PROT|nr:hypothetical protein [Gluconacetobacter takamatsuzukensis]MBB2206579.1 hypothetical protein [Gluconacetobacter takamatsuzukensis]